MNISHLHNKDNIGQVMYEELRNRWSSKSFT